MALTINKTEIDNFGLSQTLPSAYCKVCFISGDKTNINFKIDVMNTAKDFVYLQKSYSFTPSVANGSSNFIEQAYVYLKTLPEYTGATDC